MAQPDAATDVLARPEESEGRLVAVGGRDSRQYRLGAAKTSIGFFKDNDLVVNSSTVSGYHAAIQRRNGAYSLSDLESTNGTFVNGVRIKNPTILKRGDEIRFGDARFAFVLPVVQPRRSFRPGILAAIVIVLFALGFGGVRYWTRGPLAPVSVPTIATEAASSSTAAATAEPSQPSEPQPEWLASLNWYRKLCGLNPVREDPKLSQGDRAHVEYLMTNYADALKSGTLPGGEMHEEREGSPGYTADGAAAGKESDVDFVYWHGHKPDGLVNFAIVDWVSGAFHRLPLLNPDLHRVGYYDFCGPGLCVAALNALRGADQPRMHQLFSRPVLFPPDGSEIELRTFEAEWPDPLDACRGYATPTGLPITVSLGNFVTARLDSYTVESTASDGSSAKVEACGFDSSSYVSSEAHTQEAGRAVLNATATVVVIPRRPLDRGSRYTVNMTVNGHDYRWSFTVNN